MSKRDDLICEICELALLVDDEKAFTDKLKELHRLGYDAGFAAGSADAENELGA